MNFLYNGTTWDRARSASAANQSAFSGLGAIKMAKTGCWGITNVPATATKATISKAAGGAGVRHVASALTVTFAVGSSLNTAAAPLTVSLIDGASGGTTYLWQSIINLIVLIGQTYTITLSDLALVGSANTAMTLEFSAAGGTNTYQSVALAGYDVV